MSTLTNTGTLGTDNNVTICLNFGQIANTVPILTSSLENMNCSIGTENVASTLPESCAPPAFNEIKQTKCNEYEGKLYAILGDKLCEKIVKNLQPMYFEDFNKISRAEDQDELDAILARMDRMLIGASVIAETFAYEKFKAGNIVFVERFARNCVVLSCGKIITVFDFVTNSSFRTKIDDCVIVTDFDIKPLVAKIDVELLSVSDANALKTLNIHP